MIRQMGQTQKWLRSAPPFAFISFAGLAGFITYFSMYAFRKPFTAASFADVPGWHHVLDFKIALVIAQVLGYASSKIIGIRVIGAMRANQRTAAILSLIGTSWIALVVLPLAPPVIEIIALFIRASRSISLLVPPESLPILR